ncbi:MAG: transketolase [Candidatus Schekmanbacteria bacterium RBG_13_48_7]|uniref:Transketolase n=1 Tax=Candidatus Schekmanbacteria bacterium RBG_13_48_7 TaxID=1817878 RepID=A0A1F7RN57_9BACT|nr:MAG: transketolase [Candidatus Schekmanbacteria bacterium RBG_13_48_7]
MSDTKEIQRLQKIARELRVDTLVMLHLAGSGHTGGSLSLIEIITALYFKIMRHDPKNPDDPERDRFVLSKGHGGPALYVALAKTGYFPRKELWSLRKLGSILQGHPDMLLTPGVDFSTGSLGQGFSAANGMALAFKIDNKPCYVYTVIGDGESQEGQIWEAAMSASQFKLKNLIAFLDANELQIDGRVEDIKNVEPLEDKWKAFGWNTYKINGHSFQEILDAVEDAKRNPEPKPTMIISKTIKGKGISFMENMIKYHGISPTKEELKEAIIELTGDYKGIEAYQ